MPWAARQAAKRARSARYPVVESVVVVGRNSRSGPVFVRPRFVEFRVLLLDGEVRGPRLV